MESSKAGALFHRCRISRNFTTALAQVLMIDAEAPVSATIEIGSMSEGMWYGARAQNSLLQMTGEMVADRRAHPLSVELEELTPQPDTPPNRTVLNMQ